MTTSTTDTPYLRRAEFLPEFAARWEPGQHVSLLGPTGRGKSTLMAQLLPLASSHEQAVIMAPKGRDPAFAALGRHTSRWPPKRPLGPLGIFQNHDDKPRPEIWRLEIPPIKPSGGSPQAQEEAVARYFRTMRGLFASVLAGAMARPEQPKDSQVIILDDSRILSDPKQMNLGMLVTANMMIGRSKKVSVVNNIQAPRWVPRELLDQATHVLIWRNRDKDVVKRLAEISGEFEPKWIEEEIANLDYHEALWIDGAADEVYVVGP